MVGMCSVPSTICGGASMVNAPEGLVGTTIGIGIASSIWLIVLEPAGVSASEVSTNTREAAGLGTVTVARNMVAHVPPPLTVTVAVEPAVYPVPGFVRVIEEIAPPVIGLTVAVASAFLPVVSSGSFVKVTVGALA